MRSIGGAILVLLAAVAFGFMALLWNWATAGGMSTYLLLALRFGIAAGVLGLLVVMQGLPMPKGGVLAALVAMGAIGYFGESMCFFLALESKLPSGMASLLLYLNPAFVTIGARVFFGEKITPLRIAALVCAIAGLGLLLYTPDMKEAFSNTRGIVLAVATAVIYAGYLLAAGRISAKAGPMQSSLVITASAAAMFAAVVAYRAVTGHEHPPVFTWAWKGPWQTSLYFALACTVVPIMALLAGIRIIGSVRASVIAIVEPLTTVVLGAVFLHEVIQTEQKVGGALIILAAVMTAVGGGGAKR